MSLYCNSLCLFGGSIGWAQVSAATHAERSTAACDKRSAAFDPGLATWE